MKRRMRQRAIAILMTVMMVVGLVPTNLYGGGVSKVKAEESNETSYEFDTSLTANDATNTDKWKNDEATGYYQLLSGAVITQGIFSYQGVGGDKQFIIKNDGSLFRINGKITRSTGKQAIKIDLSSEEAGKKFKLSLSYASKNASPATLCLYEGSTDLTEGGSSSANESTNVTYSTSVLEGGKTYLLAGADNGITINSLVVAPAPAEVAVTGVTINGSETTVEVGKTITLTATVAPENATDKTVTWTSSDPTVATVSDGTVTGVKAGIANITATAGDVTGEVYSVTVKEATTQEFEVWFNPDGETNVSAGNYGAYPIYINEDMPKANKNPITINGKDYWGIQGKNNPRLEDNKTNPNGMIPKKGAFMKVTAPADGTITVYGMEAAGKPFYITKDDEKTPAVSSTAFPGNEPHVVEVLAGEEWYFYAQGSKAIFVGVTFELPKPIVSVPITFTGESLGSAKITFTNDRTGTQYTVGADATSVDMKSGYTYSVSIDDDTLMIDKETLDLTNGVPSSTYTIKVSKTPAHTVTGTFKGLPEGANVTKLTFTNKKSNSATNATINGKTYTVNLNNGNYTTSAEWTGADGYTVYDNVAVTGTGTEVFTNDVWFYAPEKDDSSVEFKSVLKVGKGEGNDYKTIGEALLAAKAMPRDGEYVTIELQDDEYVEQVIVDTPNIKMVAATGKKPVIRWYYGVAYKYYSIKVGTNGRGFYDEKLANDKYESNYADRWGATVRVHADGFLAEGITFINTFNQYVCDEEIGDSVIDPDSTNPYGAVATVERKAGTVVTGKDTVERATAVAVDADKAEFYQCTFISSQDTLYTDKGISYYNDCVIVGQTDYIFGDAGKAIFDNCELRWLGYTGDSKEGYIAVNRGKYLFRGCKITANSIAGFSVKAGYYGRPWSADAEVKFVGTKIASSDLILATGWTDMSGVTPEKVTYKEYGNVIGTTLDVASDAYFYSDYAKNSPSIYQLTQEDGEKIADPANDATYLGTWEPVHHITTALDLSSVSDWSQNHGPQWEQNVFGSGTAAANNTYSANDDNTVFTLEATSNKGKLASGNDGINFVNQKLASATDDFILTAKANVITWAATNQAGFGLMMRPTVGSTTDEATPLRHVFVGSNVQGSVEYAGYTVRKADKYTTAETDEERDYKRLGDLTGLVAGEEYQLVLQRVGGTVSASINGRTADITDWAQSDYTSMHVGMFVARAAKVEYSNVYLDTKSANDTVTLVSKTAPAKVVYYQGNTLDDLDLTGFSAVVNVGGEEKTIDGSQVVVKKFDASNTGDTAIELNYLGLSIEIPISVLPEEVSDVTVDYAPAKNTYLLGEEIDWAGFGGTITYNSGKVYALEDVVAGTETAGVGSVTKVDGFDSTSAGEKVVTVSHTYGGVTKSDTFKVTISDATLTNITLSGPTQTTYYKGVTPENGSYKDGLKITANFSDGSSEVISDMTASGVAITPAADVDVTTSGTKTYTVAYTVAGVTKSATYDLVVKNDEYEKLEISTYPTKSTFKKGEAFDATGIALTIYRESGNTELLTATEYSVDSSAYKADTIGEYTITVSESKSGKNLKATYVASVVESTESGFNKDDWKSIVFGQSIDKDKEPSVDGTTITVEQGEGKGKVTDAAQDGIAYYYTEIDPEDNFELTADVTVNYFITKSSPDNQEGFGIMVRDDIGTDKDSSIFYSNAISVGGYFGRYNFFGRYGYSDNTPDTFTNVAKYAKLNKDTDNLTKYQIKEDAPKTFTMTVKKDNTGVWVSMVDKSDNSNCLSAAENLPIGYADVDIENGMDMVYLPADTFTAVNSSKYYVGFMAARGAKISIDTSTIKLTKTKAVSDAPQREKEAEPVTPEIDVTSLTEWSQADYTLKVTTNTAGLLTVVHNGKTVVKQDQITAPGEYEYPLTLTMGANPVQLTFEAEETEDIKIATGAEKKLNKNVTITVKQYESLFVSPSGKSTAKGTKEDPLDVETAIAYCQPGQTIYALDGTYTFKHMVEIPHGNNGTASEPKNLFAYSSLDGVVFDFAGGSSTFNVSGDYWHVKGISVTRGTGMRVGGNHNTIELCKTYKNTDTGLQISRTDAATTIDKWPSYNTILNCDSYDNRDASDNNADGFAAKLTVGVGNEFRGCIAHNNADDGWDLFAKASLIGEVKVINCIAYGNGFCTNAAGELEKTKGDGNGFKLGGSGQPVAHEIHNSIAFGNAANGFTNNSDPIFNAYDCIGYNNGGENVELHIYTNATPDKLVVDGFYSFADDHIADMALMDGKSTGTDLSNSTVKNGNFKSTKNFLWDSKTKTSYNSEGTLLTANNFVSLAEYSDYMNLKKTYQRDENGDIVRGDFLKYQEAQADDGDGGNDEEDEAYVTTSSGNRYSTLPIKNTTSTRMIVTTAIGEAKAAAEINGSDYLEVSIEGLQMNSPAVKLIQALAAQHNLTVSSFFDVNVYRVSANGVKLARVTDLKSPLSLMFATPDGLNPSNYDFGVIYVHDGVAKLLKDQDNDPLTVSVASGEFSAYSVVYGPKGSLAGVKDGSTVGTKSSVTKNGSKASPKTADDSKFVPEVPETAIADFTQKQVEKQLEQEVADLLITPQATPFPYGIVIVAIFAMVAFIGGEVIFFRRKKQK